jgi:hypothetical protein
VRSDLDKAVSDAASTHPLRIDDEVDKKDLDAAIALAKTSVVMKVRVDVDDSELDAAIAHAKQPIHLNVASAQGPTGSSSQVDATATTSPPVSSSDIVSVSPAQLQDIIQSQSAGRQADTAGAQTNRTTNNNITVNYTSQTAPQMGPARVDQVLTDAMRYVSMS